jgi:spore maturation protein CgeB
MKILYSFNKKGFEADYWGREISAAGNDAIGFHCFNHDPYLSPSRYLRAQQLDQLYYAREPGLMRMYADLEEVIRREKPDVLLVDNCPPYHPEFLRTLDVYKALRVCDGPVTAYDRDFAYLHAYDHVLYHSPAYSRDLTMAEKLAYCGAKQASFWPLALFDVMGPGTVSEDALFARERRNSVVFVGAIYPEKMALLATIRKRYGQAFQLHGLTNWKRNLYFNLKHGAFKWVGPLDFSRYPSLYQDSKIGVNAHLRGKYTVGNYRMFDLPGNGVLQITDGADYVKDFFEPGSEILVYETHDEALDLIEQFLSRPSDREEIARNGFRRVMRDHRISKRLCDLEPILRPHLARVSR